MRRLMFGLLMCLVLVGMVGFVSAQCTDSDGGENYYVAGKVGVLGEPFITKESAVNEHVSDGLVVLSLTKAILKVAGEETEIELGNSYSFYDDTVSCYINKINFFSEGDSENNIEIIATIFYEDVCKDSDYLIEFYCDENGNVNYEEYKCPNGCEDGACVSETNETQTCTDSDGGLNEFEKGTTSYFGYDYIDHCARGGESSQWSGGVAEKGDVIEYACYDAGEFLCGSSYCHYKVLSCERGCYDGACLEEGCERVCKNVGTESEGWYNSCTGEYIEFAICGSEQKCSDPDGLDYYEKGTTLWTVSDGSTNRQEDYCMDEKRISEGYCLPEPDENNKAYRRKSFICPNGCQDGACAEEGGESELDMNPCLDNPNNYWDQETDRCYSGYSEKMIKYSCSDPDYGKNIYAQAHTFGFRSYSSAEDPSRDLRIRTGGRDGCLADGRIIEHYCDENGYIQTSYIECPNGCKEGEGVCIKGEPITEQIKCVFKNSKEEQQCYLAGQWGPADEGTKFCKGKENCIINFKGYLGEEITWKSTCGGYQYTKQDGEDETIEFDCKVGETNATEIKNKGFRHAYFQCYDGAESKSTGREACKSSEFWQKFAENFCEGHCKKYKDMEKCGVNSFGVWEECYLYEEGVPEEEIAVEEEVEGIEEYLLCKDSCPLNGKCYPFGYRKGVSYCSDEGGFIEQLSSDKSCENNFECESNVCVSDKCISAGLLQKIINWFKRLFGG